MGGHVNVGRAQTSSREPKWEPLQTDKRTSDSRFLILNLGFPFTKMREQWGHLEKRCERALEENSILNFA